MKVICQSCGERHDSETAESTWCECGKRIEDMNPEEDSMTYDNTDLQKWLKPMYDEMNEINKIIVDTVLATAAKRIKSEFGGIEKLGITFGHEFTDSDGNYNPFIMDCDVYVRGLGEDEEPMHDYEHRDHLIEIIEDVLSFIPEGAYFHLVDEWPARDKHNEETYEFLIDEAIEKGGLPA